MKHLGDFNSARWGKVNVYRATYCSADGPLAISLTTDIGEPLATLSVNMYRPQCSEDSSRLPADCFYVKNYGGQEDLAAEALASGLFVERPDLPEACSGFIKAPAWQIRSGLAS